MRQRVVGEVKDGSLAGRGRSPLKFDGLEILYTGYIANAEDFIPKRCHSKDLSDETYYGSAFAAAYRRFGESLCEEVYGQYAVIIHDPVRRHTLLSHDLLGIEPLFYRKTNVGIRFANGLADIVDDDPLDDEYIADYVCYGDHYGSRTPYASVQRLTTATSILLVDGALRIVPGWKGLRPPDSTRSFSDSAEFLEKLLDEAVRSALPRSGSAWCELSGGLDSSTVVGFAARHNSPKPETLSYVYSSSLRANERHYVKAVCEKWNLVNHQIDIDSAGAFLEAPTRPYAQPNPAMINGAFHSAMAEAISADVMLTGMGGDAVLFGDGPEPFHMADLLRQGRFIELYQTLKDWGSNEERRPMRYWLRRCVAEPTLRYARRQLIQDQPPMVSWLRRDCALVAKRNGQPRATWVTAAEDIHRAWFFERVIRSANVLAGWEFLADFRRTEFRHPLLYVPLVRFMASVRPEYAFGPCIDRRLHRTAAVAVLPDSIRERRTKGSPDQAIYRGLANSEYWRNLLTRRPQIIARGFVDEAQWMHAVQLAVHGRCESIKHFRAAATLEAWFQQSQCPRVSGIT